MKLAREEIDMIFKSLEMAASYYQFEAIKRFGTPEAKEFMAKTDAYHNLAGKFTMIDVFPTE